MSLRQLLTIALGALLLTSLGCTRGAEVLFTSPANGSTNVSSSLAQIEVAFSTELDSTNATNTSFVSVVGESSGDHPVSLALEDLLEGSGDEQQTFPGRRLVITRDSDPSNFTFTTGELVTVTISSRVTSSIGVPIQSYSFAFTVSGVTGDPDNFDPGVNQFLVASTRPEPHDRGSPLRPMVNVKFDQAAFVQDFSSFSVTVRGNRSGWRPGGIFLAADNSNPTLSDAFDFSLDAGVDSFLPGEQVTFTLTSNIGAPGAPSEDEDNPNPDEALRPFTFVFDVVTGTMNFEAGSGFEDPVSVEVSGQEFTNVLDVVVGDFLGFAGPEVILLDGDAGLFVLRQQSGNWIVQAAVTDFPTAPLALGVADLEHGGTFEAVVATEDAVFVFRIASVLAEAQNDSGAAIYTTLLDSRTEDLELVDIDSDGNLDVVLATNTGLVLLAQLPQLPLGLDVLVGTGFTAVPISDVPASEVQAGDFDEDGRIDLVVNESLGLGVYRNAGNLALARVRDLSPGFDGWFEVADFEGDGDLDVVIPGASGVAYFENNGSDTGEGGVPLETSLVQLALPNGTPDAFSIADFDGDGTSDFASYYTASGILALQARDGVDQAFEFSTDLTVPAGFSNPQIHFGDINQDTGDDVVVFGALAGSDSALTYAPTQGVQAPVDQPDYEFMVPATVQGQLGTATPVPVTANLTESVETVNIRVSFDADLVLIDAALAPGLPIDAAIEVNTDTTGVGFVQLNFSVASPLEPGEDIHLVDLLFTPRSNTVANYDYRLLNGDVEGELVRNSVVPVGGSRTSPIPAEFFESGEGVLEIGTSVPSVENVVCTPESIVSTNNDGVTTIAHQVLITWDIPAGTSYDEIAVELNDGSLAQLQGSAQQHLFTNIPTGTNVVTVTGVQGGISALPESCEFFVLAPPVNVTCTRDNPSTVSLSWDLGSSDYDNIRVVRNGSVIATLPGFQFGFVDSTASAGQQEYVVEGTETVTVGLEDFLNVAASSPCVVADEDPNVASPPTGFSATVSGNDVSLSWDNGEVYDSLEVRRDGATIATFDFSQITVSSYLDEDVPPGPHTYTLFVVAGAASTESAAVVVDVTLPAPTALTCVLNGPEAVLSWTNSATYEAIVITRELENGDVLETFSEPGTITTFTDNAGDGEFVYRVEGMFGAFTTTTGPTCLVSIRHKIRVSSLVTTLGLEDVLEVRADVLAPITGYTFVVEFDSTRFDPGATPQVLDARGLPVDLQVELIDSNVRLTAAVPSASLPAGTDIVLAAIVGATPADFSAVGSTLLDLTDGSLGTIADPILEDGTLTVVGDAMIVEPAVVFPGETLDVAVLGTFDSPIAGYQLFLEFDPNVLEVLDVEFMGSIGDILSSPLFASSFDNDLGYVTGGLVGTTGVVDPSINVPLVFIQFMVSETATAGVDTGLRLSDPDLNPDLPASLAPPVFSLEGGTASISPLFVNGLIEVSAMIPVDITSLSVTETSYYGGVSTTIQGTNLNAPNFSVSFGSTPVNVTFDSPSQLVVDVPALDPIPNPATPQTVDVTVTNDEGAVTLANGFAYQPATLTQVTPNSAVVGATVVVEGQFFSTDVANTTVSFGGVPATINSINAARTQIEVVVPAGAGAVNVEATFPGQTPAPLVDGFTYASGMAISSVVPTEGSFYGGETITITGNNLLDGNLTVTLAGIAATITSSSETEIQATVPVFPFPLPATDQLVDVTVSHDEDTVTAPDAYTYRAATLDSVSPAIAIEGTTVVISGAFLSTDLATTQVLFGATEATITDIDSAGTQITVTAPAGSGLVDVVVNMDGSQSVTLTGGFEYAPAPTLTAVTPSTGPLAGGATVTLQGTGFDQPNLSVLFNGAAVTPTAFDSTSIQFVVPGFGSVPGADTAVDIAVTTDAGNATLVGGYTYQILALSGLNPGVGPEAGAQQVTIQGAGLTAAGTSVNFGASAATVLSANEAGTELIVESPAGLGTVSVMVTLADSQTQTLLDAYTYSDSFVVDSIVPAFGSPCGQETITINGVGFVAGGVSVTFGGVAATDVVVDPSGTFLTVTNPQAAEGNVAVQVVQGATSGNVPGGFTYGFPFLRGDVNNDGAVNGADLVLLADLVVGSGALPPGPIDAADTNDDGQIHVGDLTRLSAFLDQSVVGPLPEPAAAPDFDPTPDALEEIVVGCP